MYGWFHWKWIFLLWYFLVFKSLEIMYQVTYLFALCQTLMSVRWGCATAMQTAATALGGSNAYVIKASLETETQAARV